MERHPSYPLLHLEWQDNTTEHVKCMLRHDQVTVFGSQLSYYTQMVKYLLDRARVPYREVNLDADEDGSMHKELRTALKSVLQEKIVDTSMPAVFAGYDYLGSLEELRELDANGALKELKLDFRK